MKTRPRLLRRLVPAVVVVATTAAGMAAPASAESGEQRFRISFEGPFTEAVSTDWPVRATGVVSGAGVEKFISEDPGSSPGTVVSVIELVFADGSIRVELRGTVEEEEAFGPNDCHHRASSTGTYEVLGGTGEYAGATGSGTARSRGTLLVPPSGDGCDFSRCRLVSHIDMNGSIAIPES
ncbi:MAG: hypothetical protein ACRD12_11085 [Acidimicrobiales bacterium]